MSNASKLWIPRPQDSNLQHILKTKASPEGDVKRNQQCLFKGLVYGTKYPKIHVKSFKTEPEAGPEAGIRNYQ